MQIVLIRANRVVQSNFTKIIIECPNTCDCASTTDQGKSRHNQFIQALFRATRSQALYLCLSDSKPLGYLRLYKTSDELLRAYEAQHHLRVQCPSKSAP